MNINPQLDRAVKKGVRIDRILLGAATVTPSMHAGTNAALEFEVDTSGCSVLEIASVTGTGILNAYSDSGYTVVASIGAGTVNYSTSIQGVRKLLFRTSQLTSSGYPGITLNGLNIH